MGVCGKTGEVTYQNMVEALADFDNPKWCILNFNYKCIDGGLRNKVVLIHWVYDQLKRDTLKESARVKMLSLGTLGILKNYFKGCVCFIEANDIDELQYEYI